MMSKEAMKLALKRAFQLGQDYWYQADHNSYRENKKSDETLAKFRQLVDETCEALAEQPAQQEPVAVHQFRKRECSDWYDGHPDHTDGGGPYEARTLYTSPPARHGWTTEQIAGMARLKEAQDKKLSQRKWVGLTEQKALDKMAENARELGLDYEPARDSGIVTAGGADPRTQRTWVGLTDEERTRVRNTVGYNQLVTAGEYAEHVQKATEAKLKEKNNG